MRLVLDTNLLVSYLINPGATMVDVIDRAFHAHEVLYSDATFFELSTVLSRPRLARYVRRDDMRRLLRRYAGRGTRVANPPDVIACRDPKDDKFLALAIAGQADVIVTGDPDLLALHPFRGVDILTANEIAPRL